MSRTYNAVGINLKAIPLGESDRLLTILTREQGLIRAVAPGARKPRSKLRGNSGLFLVNQLLIAKGRSLDKITQAETIKSYSKLSQNLGKLAASQYLAELVLAIALTEQPQEELFLLLNEHLNRLEQLQNTSESQTCLLVITGLVHGIFHLLALAGVAPQVQFCNLTQRLIEPNFYQLKWQVGFSITSGGIVSLSNWHQHQAKTAKAAKVAERSQDYTVETVEDSEVKIDFRLTPTQLATLQKLAQPQMIDLLAPIAVSNSAKNVTVELSDLLFIEQLLRRYTEYHLGRKIRSAPLIETYTQQEQGAKSDERNNLS
ncbi:MAG: DNA repair protein RecO [Microcoleaceae cyanobacterium]